MKIFLNKDTDGGNQPAVEPTPDNPPKTPPSVIAVSHATEKRMDEIEARLNAIEDSCRAKFSLLDKVNDALFSEKPKTTVGKKLHAVLFGEK